MLDKSELKEYVYMGNLEKLRNMTSIYLLCDDKILLLYRQGSRVVNDLWIGSAGGHFEETELNDAKACVLRELEEELSITKDMITDLDMKYITLRKIGELRQNYYFFAKLPNGTKMQLHSNEGKLKWFPIEHISELKMPFSAQFVMEHYLKVGRYDNITYAGIASGNTVVFVELTEY